MIPPQHPGSAGTAPLTNPRSDRVKAVRALSRRSVRSRQGLFLAEGPQSVREMLTHRPDTVRDVYLTAHALQRHTDIAELCSALPTRNPAARSHEVSDEVLAAMVETDAPQGVVAVCRLLDVGLDEALATVADGGFLCVLTNVRDPGNAGTVLRAADAFGAGAVIMSDASVDLYNPKVVRSTAGSIAHLPICLGVSVPDILTALRANGIRSLAADGAGTTLLPETDLSGRHAWIMGNEAWGLPEETRAMCDEVVRIPIHRAESLNLAMAATVCLHASGTR